MNQKLHPERLPDEVFVGNSSFSPVEDSVDDASEYASIIWGTKRRGIIAYDFEGKPMKGFFPVFVKTEEIQQRNPELLKWLTAD